ncbi:MULTISPECIES: hypothetical protein [Cryobacterium]|uniref:Uncharacterized protein n=1 Tax=Cryobacterium zongtaii TaxID=1259217 RepID=A0A2S3ZEP6_9MICO|nr:MULTISPECIES: hypothetical protein [Cryobacterium]POH64967.1 hypothetical protein C3B61_10815 [Cryobacterium zongtaii]POH68114.1 hypothetical protein C3B60_08045 [Cryobacterium zongtaii]TFC48113.1 hypothetical protein E3O57_04240 [Cryobacterium sp. TMN-39-2]
MTKIGNSGRSRYVTNGLQSRQALHLLWAVPVVILISLPAAAVAGISWCGISGCSGGGYGLDTSDAGLAVRACIFAAVVMTVPFALIAWLKPRTVRIVVALAIGTLWGLLVAVVTHGIFPWRLG